MLSSPGGGRAGRQAEMKSPTDPITSLKMAAAADERKGRGGVPSLHGRGGGQ